MNEVFSPGVAMVMSTFQKVTLATCVVLCVALLLPRMLLSRGRKDASGTEGHFPPMVHRQMAPEARGQRVGSSSSSRGHKTEAVVARTKGAGAGGGLGTAAKSNLAGQIIPVYGFGILLYILYILFKITSKGSSQPPLCRFSSLRSENTKRKITDFELLQLQEKLRETEMAMENIVSKAHRSPDRDNREVNVDQESLLQQLTEITRAMHEGQLVEDVARPNTRPREQADSHDSRERSHCCCQHPPGTKDDQGDYSETVPLDADGADDTAGKDEIQEVGLNEMEQRQGEGKEEQPELGMPEDELPGVLKELEITLKMTSTVERETVARLEAQVVNGGGGQVRRRNKRRSKKETQ
ncbi:protein RIC-3b isoform X2 [Stigmatopora nigra]